MPVALFSLVASLSPSSLTTVIEKKKLYTVGIHIVPYLSYGLYLYRYYLGKHEFHKVLLTVPIHKKWAGFHIPIF